jgi:hypothetical protein
MHARLIALSPMVLLRLAQSVTATAALLLTTACGGGGSDDSGDTPPTAQQTQAVESLLIMAERVLSMPQTLGSFVSPAMALDALCVAGSGTATYDGATVTTGQSLEFGSHTLGLSLADCGLAFTGGQAVTNGSLAYDYSWASSNAASPLFRPYTGFAQATASNFRTVLPGGIDYSIAGAYRVESSQSTAASGTVTMSDRTIPSAGAVIVNQSTGRSITFTSGSVAVALDAAPAGASFAPSAYRLDYADLSFTHQGASYVVRGSENYTLDPTGAPTAASGTITISRNGAIVAKAAPALPSGWRVTSVTGTVDPF